MYFHFFVFFHSSSFFLSLLFFLSFFIFILFFSFLFLSFHLFFSLFFFFFFLFVGSSKFFWVPQFRLRFSLDIFFKKKMFGPSRVVKKKTIEASFPFFPPFFFLPPPLSFFFLPFFLFFFSFSKIISFLLKNVFLFSSLSKYMPLPAFVLRFNKKMFPPSSVLHGHAVI